jgi:O-antigen/teichoic acid export membrane protein
MASVRLAAVYSLGQRYVAFVIQLVVTVIVARLLTPAEVGIFALGAAVSAVAQFLREFGVGSYLISEKTLDQAKLRAAFTVTAITAWGAGLLLVLAAWPLALAYSEPGAGWVLAVLSLNYFLLPLGMVPNARLTRDLRFKELFWVQNVAALVSGIVTVLYAVLGHSYMSLAYGAVVSNVVTVVGLAVVHRGEIWLRPTLAGLGAVFRFGGALTLGRMADQVAARSNEFIVSATLGFHAAGLLSKSQSLAASFNDFFAAGLARVAMPALAKVRHEGGSITEPFLKGTQLIAAALWIFFGLLGVFAHEVIAILFGGQWMQSVPVLQVLCAASMLYGPYMLAYPLLTSMGLVGDLLRIQLFGAPLMIGCIFVGALFGLVWVAAVPMLATLVRLVMTQRVLTRQCGVSGATLMRSLARGAVGCGIVIAAAALVRWQLVQMELPAALVLVLGSSAAMALALPLAAWLDHPIWQEIVRALRAGKARRVAITP